MNQENLIFTAHCGIYCGDCIHYKNKHSKLASDLKRELERVGFDKYADIKSPFGEDLRYYKEFISVLNSLANHYCNDPCRTGNGCSSTTCKIIKCCQSKKIIGCWECRQIDSCEKFEFLEPRCGNMPKNNLKKIKKFGLDNWIEYRDQFYIWL
ncbi:MAG: DUF3795 domain-containing protein [Firmicutes bacterium]|nr:DUF3795 domain-containing protein [Bacillota bacterium]